MHCQWSVTFLYSHEAVHVVITFVVGLREILNENLIMVVENESIGETDLFLFVVNVKVNSVPNPFLFVLVSKILTDRISDEIGLLFSLIKNVNIDQTFLIVTVTEIRDVFIIRSDELVVQVNEGLLIFGRL